MYNKHVLVLFLMYLFFIFSIIMIVKRPSLKYKKHIPYTVDGEEIPKIIWTFWDKEELPEFIQLCIDTWKKHNPDYEIHVVNKKSAMQYVPGVDVFSFPHCQNNIQKCSDFLRLYLLYLYGGFWIDASSILNGSLEFYRNIQKEKKSEIVGYYIHGFTTNPAYPVIENWFIAAVPHSRIIKLWLITFLQMNKYDSVFDYLQRLKHDGVDFQKIMDPSYLTMHIAGQFVMQKLLNEEDVQKVFHLLKAEDEPFKYLVKNNWNSEKAMKDLVKNKDLHTLLVKMRGCERKALDNSKINIKDLFMTQ